MSRSKSTRRMQQNIILSPFLFHNLFSLRRTKRSRAIMAAVLITISAITLAWQQGGVSAAFVSPVSESMASSAEALRQDAGGPSITISTVAGGGFSSNIQVKQAPMSLPSGVALDPQSRGFYVLDDSDSNSLLRFVNTTSDNITLAGTTVFSQHINLIAGGGQLFDEGAAALETGLAVVTGLAVDPSGNAVYLATPAGGGIRVLNVGTQNFIVLGKTIAPGKITTVFAPSATDYRALALHPLTNELYFISDNAVYRLDANGNQIVYAGNGNPTPGNGDGGPATGARLTTPRGLAFDAQGNLFIAEAGEVRAGGVPGSVRKVAASDRKISTLATNLDYPIGIAISPDNNVFVALAITPQIMRISPAGVKTVVAGNSLACNMETKPTCGDGGTASSADLSPPSNNDNRSLTLVADATGFYIPDFNYKRVRYVNLSGAPVTIAGTSIGTQKIDSVAGNGIAPPYDHTLATATELQTPTGVAADAQGNFFISDMGHSILRFVNRGVAPITLLAGTPSAQTVQPGQIVTLNNNVGSATEPNDGRISTTQLASPQGLALTSKGLFITDSQGGVRFPNLLQGPRSGLVRFLNTSSTDVTVFGITVAPGMCSIVAGLPQGTKKADVPSTINDGAQATKAIIFPTDVAVDASGNLFIADQGNNRIRKVDAVTGLINTIYGNGTTALLNGATGVTLDNTGRLHIADTRNNRILRQDAADSLNFSVIADSSLGIGLPRGLTVDSSGKIYITNTLTHQVLQLIAPDNQLGAVSMIAGTGEAGFSGDNGEAGLARLNLPNPTANELQVTAEIVALSNGVLAFTDTDNQRVRLMVRIATIPSPLPVTTVSGASFTPSVASESIVSAFGTSLVVSPLVRFATSLPLPTTLAGTTIKVKDSNNVTRDAPMFFAFSGQINYLIPQGTATGLATVTVTSADGQASVGTVDVASVAPGFFTANSDGQGVPAAVLQRFDAQFKESYETISKFDPQLNRLVSTPIDLGPEGDQLFLIMFGTGIRGNTGLGQVSATIGGQAAEVLYAGAQGGFVGLDQVNIRIPRTLLTVVHGEVDLVLTVNGKKALPVKINIK